MSLSLFLLNKSFLLRSYQVRTMLGWGKKLATKIVPVPSK
jgi:hypothetical protein